jgi:D-xylose transport system permease protein
MSAVAGPAPETQRVETPAAREGIRRALAQGEFGAIRVILMLAVIGTVFQLLNDRFLSAGNLTNLLLQITAIGLISVGVFLVLLLGEIDLSVGAVSGLAAGVMAVLTVKHGWAPVPGIVAALCVGLIIGTVNGLAVTALGIPSFVVTLAGLLAWQGALLAVLGDTGTINLPDSSITGLTSTFYSDAVGWIMAVVVIAAYGGLTLLGHRRRLAAGLETQRPATLLLRFCVASAAILASVAVLNSNRGVPLAALILVGFVALFAFWTERTRYGRHIYAIGGNIEASRRAGIRVDAARVGVFALASTMAAAGGVMAASRGLSVNQSSGGSDVLLLAIAGPVIAGTSLFGGRGSAWSALLGALVIGSISNGMDLLALESSVKYMITGAVLFGAVVIDALTRRQRLQAGRR